MNNFFLNTLIVFSFVLTFTNSYAQTSVKELKAQLKVVESALETDPSNLDHLWQYAGINYELGRLTSKIDYYQTARDRYNTLHQLVPDDPRVLSLAYSSTYSLVWLGETSDTSTLRTLFNKADLETKKLLSPPSTAQLFGRIKRPDTYGDQLKSIEEVEKLYIKNLRDGIKEQPYYIENYQFLSSMYARKGQYLLAIAIAKQGSQKAPENAVVLNGIGELYIDQAQSDGCSYNDEKGLKNAESHFLKAIKLDPKKSLYRSNLSSIYEYQRRKFLTLNEAKKAYELEPSLLSIELWATVEILYGSIEKSKELLKEATNTYGAKNTKGIKWMLALTERDFPKAYKLTKITQQSNVYDHINKGIFGDQSKKKKGLFYYAKKALDNKNIEGRGRKLAEYLAGEITYEELTETNATPCDELEAHFYHGYKSMIDGNVALAKSQFETALKFELLSYTEHDLAQFFIEQLSN